jgi:DNA-binding protein HU-beta
MDFPPELYLGSWNFCKKYRLFDGSSLCRGQQPLSTGPKWSMTTDTGAHTMSEEAIAPRRGRLTGGVSPAGREELVSYVARDLDTTKADAHLIVDSVTRAIAEMSRRHPLVRVPNLGNFRVLETGAREGRNPRTGEAVAIAPGRRISFRAAKSLKGSVNGKKSGG